MNKQGIFMFTKEKLLEEAKKFNTYEDYIISIQTELGVYDNKGNRVPITRDEEGKLVDRASKEAREKLEFIYSLFPGKGWFYIVAEIWNESHNYPRPKNTYLR